MLLDQLKPGVILRGPIFPEPIQVVLVTPMGTSMKLIGKGLTTGKFHDPILTPDLRWDLTEEPGLFEEVSELGPKDAGEHIVFGTDYPMDLSLGDKFIKKTIDAVHRMKISDADKELIFAGNAKRILHLDIS